MKYTMITLAILLITILMTCCNSSNPKSKGNMLSDEDYQKYLETGQKIAEKTQNTLLQHVGQALKTGGAEYAISYCNIEAMNLKDSLSEEYDVEIARISEKYRNPKDKPDTPDEKMILSHYANTEHQTMSHDTVIKAGDGSIIYFKPIFIKMDACLQCHGKPENDIKPATLARINELYPNDKATGFEMNDLRGAWQVTFEE